MRSYDFSIGSGIILSENIRKDNRASDHSKNPILNAIPMVSFRYWRFRSRGPGLEFIVFEKGPIAMNLSLEYRGDLYHGDRMYFRKKSFFTGFNMRLFMLNISYMHDVESESHGSILKIGLGHRMGLLDSVFIMPSLGFSFYDKSYVSYYFGVREDEVMFDRPYYNPNSAVVFYVGNSLMISLGANWGCRLFLGLDVLPSEIHQSPTVVKRTKWSSMMGITYNF